MYVKSSLMQKLHLFGLTWSKKTSVISMPKFPIDSYCENWYLADLPRKCQMAVSCTFLLWELIPGRSSDRSTIFTVHLPITLHLQITLHCTCRSTPQNRQFEIHTARVLLWGLRQTRWQIKWQIYPPENGNLRFILIDSYCGSSDRPGDRSSGRSIPPQKMAIWDSYW